jgi:hypothetical protein
MFFAFTTLCFGRFYGTVYIKEKVCHVEVSTLQAVYTKWLLLLLLLLLLLKENYILLSVSYTLEA